jgi:hypothetical protein
MAISKLNLPDAVWSSVIEMEIDFESLVAFQTVVVGTACAPVTRRFLLGEKMRFSA